MIDVRTRKAEGLVKLTGTIANYKCTRAEASFVFEDSDRTKLGVIAVAASIAGLSGQAISTAANASGVEEEADYVEFDLDGQPVKGWVWRSPLKEGDAVEVAAEWRGDHYETGAIARPMDRVVALTTVRLKVEQNQLLARRADRNADAKCPSESGTSGHARLRSLEEVLPDAAERRGESDLRSLVRIRRRDSWVPFAGRAESNGGQAAQGQHDLAPEKRTP